MIEVKQLTKIYKSRRGGKCTALDRISFTLPDTGFVFIVGKSGSGKTTLLSLLGGLDTITSGEIVENGRQIDKFTLKEQVYYRNSTVGFIFQDFHLVDGLTILENVMLALQLQGEEDEARVRKALADTDLSDCAERYPKELSGGQKQRVAIARALVKQPPILLADEPTGNLDSRTTEQILGLLKELSREKLVVIVSHNLSDAERYADEILELSDGKILQHVRRNEAFDARLRMEGDTLVVPYGQEFSEEDLAAAERELAVRPPRKLRQDKKRFLPYEETRSGGTMSEVPPLERRHLTAGGRAKLAAKFARRGWVRVSAYAVIFAAIMVALGLAQLIMNFNGGEVVAKEMADRNLNCTSFMKDGNSHYDSVDTTRLVDVEEGALQAFYDAGYEGEAYPIVNYSLLNTASDVDVGQKRLTTKQNPYTITGTGGLIIADESFLEKVFGDVQYIVRSQTPQEYGLYITDFFADAYLACHPTQITSYAQLLDKFNSATGYVYGYINGIIRTGYRERHKALLERFSDPSLPKEEAIRLSQTNEGFALYDEISQYLNVSYSFNPDFVQAVTDAKIRQFVSSGISTFKYQNRTCEYRESWFSASDLHNPVPLGDNEIIMNYDIYNKIFGANFTAQTMDQFLPHEVEFTYYLLCDENMSRLKYTDTLKIVGLNDNRVRINLADNVLKKLQRVEMFTFGYYFENGSRTELLIKTAAENGFIPNSSIAGSISAMTKAVGVFSDFFVLIFVVLCAALLLLMVQFELKSIKDRIKDIGILKALGAREGDLIAIFGFQIAVACLLMILLYIAGSFVFIGLANRILVLSLNELASSTMVMDLTFLTVKWNYLLQNCALALAIFAVSFLVPMLRLRGIRPTNVIKAKE